MKVENIELIKNTDLFLKFEKEELEKVLKKVKYKIIKYQKGEHVAFRGDKIKGVYINLEGILVAEMLKDNGEVKKIEELRNGKIIAGAFIFGKFNKFPVDLIAKSEVKIFFIEKKYLLELMREYESILKIFLDEISDKAQFLSKNLWESISNKTINQKLSEYIMKNEKDGIIIFKESIKDIAANFNVSRPSLSRVLKNFLEDGIILKIEKGKYKILNRNLLE